MTPYELNTTRRKLLLTQQDLADRLEISCGTVGRWEREDAPIPRWAALAVRYLATDRVSQEGDWDFVGPLQEKPSRGLSPEEIGIRDNVFADDDFRYTEEEKNILYQRHDNLRAIFRPHPPVNK